MCQRTDSSQRTFSADLLITHTLLMESLTVAFTTCLQRLEELRLSMPDQCHNVMNEKPEAQRGKAL